jgi:hypothetical protein
MKSYPSLTEGGYLRNLWYGLLSFLMAGAITLLAIIAWIIGIALVIGIPVLVVCLIIKLIF